MGSTVPAGVAAPGTTATDSAAVRAPTTAAAVREEAVGAAETQAARGRPAWPLPLVAGLAVLGLPSW